MRFSRDARAALTAEWIALEDAIDMVKRAAKVTHPKGNRRYHDWVFQVQGDLVVGAWFEAREKTLDKTQNGGTIAAPVQLKPDQFFVYDDCEQCDGAGCDQCNHEGHVAVVRSTKKPLLI